MIRHRLWSIVRVALCCVLLGCTGVSLGGSTSVPTADSLAPTPFPSTTAATTSLPTSSSPSTLQSEGFLDEVSKDTWTYLSSPWATSNHMPWSWRSPTLTGGSYANSAEIGLYALSWLAAYDLDRSWSPSWVETEGEVLAILDRLRAWQTGSQSEQPHGPNAYQNSVFYQWYWIEWTPPVVGSGDEDHLVPSVDNAWLAASLITIREYAEAHNHPTLAQRASAILADMDFTLWYDTDTHRFHWGGIEDPQGGTLADYYSNESRIINFVAYAMGQLSTEEFHLSLDTLEQSAQSYDGITVTKVAWDGSYFTYATPALFIREMETVYGTDTILPATQAQIAYAQNEGYDAWGLSDCYDVGDGGYVQQGAQPAAMPDPPETRPGLVTPHAGALALITPLSAESIDNLETISTTFTCAYSDTYGFLDAVMTAPTAEDYGQCSNRFSSLAQEWIFLALINHQSGFVWDYFYRDVGVVTAHIEMFGGYPVYLPLVINNS